MANKLPAKQAEGELTQITKQVVKHKTSGNPALTEDAYLIEDDSERAEYNRKILTHLVSMYKQPRVETEQEAIERTDTYFSECANKGIKPTIEGYALALGITRQTLWNWETEKNRGPVAFDLIKRAKDIIAAYDAQLAMDNKVFPGTYAFRAKNYYGMKDQQDVVVTPNTLEARPRAELIAEAELLPGDEE